MKSIWRNYVVFFLHIRLFWLSFYGFHWCWILSVLVRSSEHWITNHTRYKWLFANNCQSISTRNNIFQEIIPFWASLSVLQYSLTKQISIYNGMQFLFRRESFVNSAAYKFLETCTRNCGCACSLLSNFWPLLDSFNPLNLGTVTSNLRNKTRISEQL